MGLELLELTKKFSAFMVGPLNFKADGNVTVMIGPTGSGKTTVLNLIAGITKADAGSILIDGADITNIPVESRRIGYVFQTPSLFPHLNVYENVIFGLQKGRPRKNNPDVKKLLDNMDIAHLSGRRIHELSGGEMQKISLARMLASEPRIILLDEPLAHLDPLTRRKFRLELRRILRTEGIPAIYVTHFVEDVYALADSVAILKNGTIENTGRLEEILGSNHSPFLSQTMEDGNYVEGKVIESRDGITVFKIGSHLLQTIGQYALNSRVGIMIRPEDIILATEAVKTSARNTLKVEVVKMDQVNSVMELQLRTDSLFLRARITSEAHKELQINVGDQIYAIFKAISPQVVREESG